VLHAHVFFYNSVGDGLSFPVRTVDEDYDSLLGQRQRWMEDGDVDSNGIELAQQWLEKL